MSWADVQEDIVDLVEFWGLGRNLPFELHELDDHLQDFAVHCDLTVLDGWERLNLLTTEAETFELARWEEMMERTAEHGC